MSSICIGGENAQVLKIFHVSAEGERFNYLTQNYDTYSDFVVVCETEEEARNTLPGGENSWTGWSEPRPDRLTPLVKGWILRSDVPFLTVTELGITTNPKLTRSTIICASFHAG